MRDVGFRLAVIDILQSRRRRCVQMKEEKKEEAKRQRRCSPVEGLLVLLDLAARQLVELGVHVYELVLLLHLLALLELVVDPLSPAEQATEFGVRWHDPLSILSIRIHVDERERENSALKARALRRRLRVRGTRLP